MEVMLKKTLKFSVDDYNSVEVDVEIKECWNFDDIYDKSNTILIEIKQLFKNGKQLNNGSEYKEFLDIYGHDIRKYFLMEIVPEGHSFKNFTHYLTPTGE